MRHPSIHRRGLISLLFVFSLFVAGITLLMTASKFSDTADPAIFIRVLSGWSNGLALYEQVFDKKDFGFFALNLPLFKLFGVPGFLLSSLVWVLLFTLGLFFFLRSVASTPLSLLLAIFGAYLWVNSGFFYPQYVETTAAALLALGLGVAVTRPLLGGLLLGTLVATKLNYVIPVAAAAIPLLGSDVGQLLMQRHKPFDAKNISTRLRNSSLLKYALGSLLSFLLFLAAAAAAGSLNGWIDVVQVNRAYSAQVALGPFRGIPRIFVELTQNDLVTLMLGISALFLILVVTSKSLRRKVIDARGNQMLLCAAPGLAISISLQGASGYQNSTMVALIILFLCFNIAITTQGALRNLRHRERCSHLPSVFFAITGAGVLVFAALRITLPELSGLPERASRAWNLASVPPSIDFTMNELPAHGTLAMLISTNPRLHFIASNHLELVCRFHFLYPVDVALFRSEHEMCLNARPDFVIWEDSAVYGEWLGFAEYWTSQRDKVKANYSLCGEFESLSIYAASESKCPYIHNTNP